MLNRLDIRIAILYSGLLISILVGISFYVSSYVRNIFIDNIKSQLLSEARLVSNQMGTITVQKSMGTFTESLVENYSRMLNVRITVILPDGSIAAESNLDKSEMDNHLSRPEVIAALRGEEGVSIRFSTTVKQEMIYAAVPVFSGNEVISVIRLSLPLTMLMDRISALNRILLAVIIIVTIIVSAMAYVIARITTQPLRFLTENVHRVSSGDEEEITPLERNDEVGLLNQAFRRLSMQLRERITELQKERGLLEAVLSNMTDGIIIVDGEGVVRLINPAAVKMFGVSEENALGKTLIEVLRSHQLVELWRKSNMTRQTETTTLETSPERLFIQAVATSLGSDLPDQTLLIIQDLTRIKRLEIVRRDFVSNVSHEIRTPLASLKALTETLHEGALEDPPAARRFLSQMDTEIDNLTQLVRELLELSRIESGRVPFHRSNVDSNQLIQDAVGRMKLQAERAGLTLKFEPKEQLPQIRVDKERVEQVLVNLIHNAIKFTPPGGTIQIHNSLERGQVLIVVEDTGVGIAEADLPRIFERFYKADRARSGGGTGLGLSIARHTVEAHGGRIWAESEPGHGSRFYLSFPAV